MTITEKEKQCILLTADHNVPRQKPSIFKDIVKSLKEPFTEQPIWLMLLSLLLYILLFPVTVYEIIKEYKNNKAEYENLVDKFYNFNGYRGEKHIAGFWNEYGLEPLSFDGREKEKKLADCLIAWITILYDEPFYVSSDEIITMFEKEQKEQGEAYNEAYEKSGTRLNFVNWRVVVVDDILNLLPNYA